MQHIDLREFKRELRQKAKSSRAELIGTKKTQLDKRVTANILKMREYIAAETVYIYVSTEIEVDTFGVITAALRCGKKVAVPRCIPGTRNMTFHYITAISDLAPGSFGVLEPNETLPIATKHENSIMIAPALIIDSYGFRLGYGKGYYDRYLANYTGVTAGICYLSDLAEQIPHGRYDRSLNYIITDRYIKKSKKLKGGSHIERRFKQLQSFENR